jgi:hypothetical protein
VRLRSETAGKANGPGKMVQHPEAPGAGPGGNAEGRQCAFVSGGTSRPRTSETGSGTLGTRWVEEGGVSRGHRTALAKAGRPKAVGMATGQRQSRRRGWHGHRRLSRVCLSTVRMIHLLPRPYDLHWGQIRKSDDLDNDCAKSWRHVGFIGAFGTRLFLPPLPPSIGRQQLPRNAYAVQPVHDRWQPGNLPDHSGLHRNDG